MNERETNKDAIITVADLNKFVSAATKQKQFELSFHPYGPPD